MQGSEAAYSIKSKHSGRCLEFSGDPSAKGMLIINDYEGRVANHFILKPNGPEVELVCKETGKCITVQGNSNKNGAALLGGDCKSEEGQVFRMSEFSPHSNEFFIYTFCGKVLDCFEGSKYAGTKVIQWEFNGGDNQKWILKKL